LDPLQKFCELIT